MKGFVKIYESILDSTIWHEKPYIKVAWMTMLVLADADGIVSMPLPSLARRAGITKDEMFEALQMFQQPDSYSRTKDNEGRRIQEVELPGNEHGWLILNHTKYRELRTVRQEQNRESQERFRKKQTLISKHSNQPSSQKSTEAEAEAEAEEEDPNPQDPHPQKKTNRPRAGGGGGGKTAELWNEIIEEWNRYAGKHDWVPISSISPAGRRGRAFGARLKEPFFVENWEEALGKMAKVPFFSGASRENYHAKFEFFVRPDSVDKLICGSYAPPKDKNEGDSTMPF